MIDSEPDRLSPLPLPQASIAVGDAPFVLVLETFGYAFILGML